MLDVLIAAGIGALAATGAYVGARTAQENRPLEQLEICAPAQVGEMRFVWRPL